MEVNKLAEQLKVKVAELEQERTSRLEARQSLLQAMNQTEARLLRIDEAVMQLNEVLALFANGDGNVTDVTEKSEDNHE